MDLPFSLELKEEQSAWKKDQKLTLVNVGSAAAKCFLVSELQQKLEISKFTWITELGADESLSVTGQMMLEHFQVLTEPNLVAYYQWIQQPRGIALIENLSFFQESCGPTKEQISAEKLIFTQGQEVSVFRVFEQLEALGYEPGLDRSITVGQFRREGENLFIFPLNSAEAYQIVLDGDCIEQLFLVANPTQTVPQLEVWPVRFSATLETPWIELWNQDPNGAFIADDLNQDFPRKNASCITFTSFPDNQETFFHLNFFSVLPFYTIPDFITELKDRRRRGFSVVIATKHREEIEKILQEHHFRWTDQDQAEPTEGLEPIYLRELESEVFLPHSFQNNTRQQLFLTDREIFQFQRSSQQKKAIKGLNLQTLNALKPGDFVIHLDHGIAQFTGIEQRDMGSEKREYLSLVYAESDRLLVPVESAEKVSKFIGESAPKLTRLHSNDWQKIQSRAKKEAERIAKDLLKIYADRAVKGGIKMTGAEEKLEQFCADFPYELTPGQASAWTEVQLDMGSERFMDRLVCGDVGFGKTEIAMRAAFKAFCAGYQCALLSPITILAEQHYQSFIKRLNDRDYGVRIELLSRFQSEADQKRILRDIEHGLVDIVIGTHRLLSNDVRFKKLGLLIIDEEQRFGVQQKEKLKSLRTNLDLLTLTATPIPRTLHLGLNKLKDISTITTPPPGRLPIVTEVRRFNLTLIKERIEYELSRGGQVYFLHNRVQTIESLAQQLRDLLPETKFIVAHGQLSPTVLEERIHQFKEGEAQVLIASTIIENGIDLPRANTLIVNSAENFGLSQLYQLRGRVGRGKEQAYAYFLYQGQKLEFDAKKRLRAIVEASELGAGFQISMKDLEIRGAGEILGASQSGSMKDVGVSHFLRLLHRTIEEIKTGETASVQEQVQEQVSVEIPLSAYLPVDYIPVADEKIQVYQQLSGVKNEEQLTEVRREILEDYGTLPEPVENLCRVVSLKLLLQKANLSGLRLHQKSHKSYEVILRMGARFSPEQIFQFLPKTQQRWIIGATALKLEWAPLPRQWYELLKADLAHLQAPKKTKTKAKQPLKKKD